MNEKRSHKFQASRAKLLDYWQQRFPRSGSAASQETCANALRLFLEWATPRQRIGEFEQGDITKFRDWLHLSRGWHMIVSSRYARAIVRVLHHAEPDRFEIPKYVTRRIKPEALAAPVVTTERMSPHDWHARPKGFEGACPTCGIHESHAGQSHRAVADDEPGLDCRWLVRRNLSKGWSFICCGSRRSEQTQQPPAMLPMPQQQQVGRGTLAESLARYKAEREISRRAHYQLDQAAKRFSDWLGRDALLVDLTDDNVNAFIASYDDGIRSRSTVRNLRNNIVSLWHAAFERGEVLLKAQRVRRVKVTPKIPTAWTRGEVIKLLDAAETMTTTHRGVVVGKLLKALWLTAYDSGLRRSDLLRLRWSDIAADGLIVLTMSKTQQIIRCRLRPGTVAAIEDTGAREREYVFSGVLGPRKFYEACCANVRLAGLRGGLQQMRRTSATLLESVAPGASMAHLGHRTPGLAFKSYVDPRLTQCDKPLPPPINS